MCVSVCIAVKDAHWVSGDPGLRGKRLHYLKQNSPVFLIHFHHEKKSKESLRSGAHRCKFNANANTQKGAIKTIQRVMKIGR